MFIHTHLADSLYIVSTEKCVKDWGSFPVQSLRIIMFKKEKKKF